MGNILSLASESPDPVLFSFRSELLEADALHRVIDGADSTLDQMERVPVNAKNRPLEEIKINSVSRSSYYRHLGLGANDSDHNTRQPNRRVIKMIVEY